MTLLDLARAPGRATVLVGRGVADAAGRSALAGLDALLAWRYTDQAVRRLLDSEVANRAVDHALRGPLVDTLVERLLESEDLWLLVDEIAHSPPVTDAIGRQGVGFAEQVAGHVRTRTRRADARLEQVARQLLRREAAPTDAATDAEAR